MITSSKKNSILSLFIHCVFVVCSITKLNFFFRSTTPLNNPSSSSAFFHHPTHSSPFLRKKISSCREKNYFILFYFCKLERVREKILDGIAQRQFLSRMRKKKFFSQQQQKNLSCLAKPVKKFTTVLVL